MTEPKTTRLWGELGPPTHRPEAVATLPIIVRMAAYESADEGKMFRVAESHNHVLREVPVDALQAGLARVCAGIEQALAGLTQEGRFPLKEVAFKVVVNAEGEVAILAAGGEDGELTLRFGAD